MRKGNFILVGIILFLAHLLSGGGLALDATAGEPKFGGTLKVHTKSIKSLDPLFMAATHVRIPSRHIYDFLFAWDEKGEVRPMMVEKWNVSKDLKTYTFTLREGLLFHNGQPVTSEDVIASLGRWFKIGTWGKQIGSILDRMEKVDDLTFTIKLKQPYGLLPRAMGKRGSFLPIITPKDLAANTPSGEPIKQYIGSGPFRLVEFKPGRHIILERFKGYKPRPEPPSGFAGGKIVYVDRLEFIEVPDVATQIAALETGELQYLDGVEPDQLPRVESNPDIKTFVIPGYGWPAILFNKCRPPFNNVKMRQAVQAALNIDEFMTLAIGDKRFWRSSPDIFFSGGMWESKAGQEFFNQADFEKARDLLQKAGGPPAEPILLLTAKAYIRYYKIAVAMKPLLEKLGFKVDFRVYDWATLVARTKKKEGWDMYTTGMSSIANAEPTSTVWLNPKWKGCWESPRMQTLVQEFTFAADNSERKMIIDKMQRLFYEEVPLLRFGEYSMIKAFRKELKGFITTTQEPIFWNAWLDK